MKRIAERFWPELLSLFAAVATVVFCVAGPALAQNPVRIDPGTGDLTDSAAASRPAPATEPSQRPAVHPSAAQLARWISDLGNDDPDARDKAAQSLMSLSADDLPALRAAALAQKGLVPGQITAIRDAVTEVFLASHPYPGAPQAFLGLHWPEPPNSGNSGGVVVSDRIPGTCAYRMLRPGDVIEEIVEQPNLNLMTKPPDVAQSVFSEFIRGLTPGDRLHLQIQRAGKIVEVPIQLDALPQGLIAGDFDDWLAGRMKVADDYWQKTFSVIDPDSQAAATTEP